MIDRMGMGKVGLGTRSKNLFLKKNPKVFLYIRNWVMFKRLGPKVTLPEAAIVLHVVLHH